MEKVIEPRRCACGKITNHKSLRCGLCAMKAHAQQRLKGLCKKRAEYWIAENI